MLKAIRAIYDDGQVKLLGEELRGKYEVILIFLETLPEDEVEDMILAKQLGLEKDYNNALSALKVNKVISTDRLRKNLKGKISG